MTLADVGSLITILGSVGAFLIWLYKKYVQEPDQKIREKNAEDLLRADQEQRDHITSVLVPISDQIQRLNENLEESQVDRIKIHNRLDSHEDYLVDHDKRISKIEQEFEGGDNNG